mmetsp:Transcript_10913/g.28341  ORF Transcript_10913/g.28341 Transcript_10913/m.28341 type:complete len:349 (+) Transcript_10913:92-1138(+)
MRRPLPSDSPVSSPLSQRHCTNASRWKMQRAGDGKALELSPRIMVSQLPPSIGYPHRRPSNENASPNCSPMRHRPGSDGLGFPHVTPWGAAAAAAGSGSGRASPHSPAQGLARPSRPPPPAWRQQLPSPLALPGSPRLLEGAGSPVHGNSPLATPRRASSAPRRNITRIRPRLLIGNDVAARSRELLSAHGVTHVLNAGRTAEHFRGEEGGPDYLSLGLRDDIAINADELNEQLLRAVDFIAASLGSGGDACVLVHCREGISRSCGVMLAFLMVTEGLPLTAAMEELRALHQKCDPNLGFLMALQEWPEWYAARRGNARLDFGRPEHEAAMGDVPEPPLAPAVEGAMM